MANSNGWGDGAANNTIGWGQGANNVIGWGSVYAVSSAGRTDIIGATATAPVNTVAPLVSGSPYVGDLLTTTDGTWTGSPTSYSYQWKRGATNIGTNANTYTLVSADANTNITCVNSNKRNRFNKCDIKCFLAFTFNCTCKYRPTCNR